MPISAMKFLQKFRRRMYTPFPPSRPLRHALLQHFALRSEDAQLRQLAHFQKATSQSAISLVVLLVLIFGLRLFLHRTTHSINFIIYWDYKVRKVI